MTRSTGVITPIMGGTIKVIIDILMNGKSKMPDDLCKALKAYGSMAEVKQGLAIYFKFYNEKRWHQNFDRKTPAMVYCNTLPQRQVAA